MQNVTYSPHQKFHPFTEEPILTKTKKATKSQIQELEQSLQTERQASHEDQQRTKKEVEDLQRTIGSLKESLNEAKRQARQDNAEIIKLKKSLAEEEQWFKKAKEDAEKTIDSLNDELKEENRKFKAEKNSRLEINSQANLARLSERSTIRENLNQLQKIQFLEERLKKLQKCIQASEQEIRQLSDRLESTETDKKNTILDFSREIISIKAKNALVPKEILSRSIALKSKLAAGNMVSMYKVGYYNTFTSKIGKFVRKEGESSPWKTLKVSEMYPGVHVWFNTDAIEPLTDQPYRSLIEKTPYLLAIRGESHYNQLSRLFYPCDAQTLYRDIENVAIAHAAGLADQVFYYYQITLFDPKQEVLDVELIGHSQEKEAKGFYMDAYFRANRKDHSGFFDLGYCYYKGYGVKENRELAIKHFKLAANQKYNPSHSKDKDQEYEFATLHAILGDYYKFIGVPYKALEHWTIAHEKQNDPVAACRLTNYYYKLALSTVSTIGAKVATLVNSNVVNSQLTHSMISTITVSQTAILLTVCTTGILKTLNLKKDSLLHNLPIWVSRMGSAVSSLHGANSAFNMLRPLDLLFNDPQLASRIRTLLSPYTPQNERINVIFQMVQNAMIYIAKNLGNTAVLGMGVTGGALVTYYTVRQIQQPALDDYDAHIKRKA